MSDQPDDQHNLEHHIPGLRQAVHNLSQITSSSGFHLATIVITHQPTRDGAPAPPTRITFAPPIPQPQPMAATTQPPERWISGPPPQPHQWRPGEPLPSLPQIHAIQPPHHPQQPPHPPPTTSTTSSQLPAPPARPKRASTSILDSPDQQSSPVGKRKRFSDTTDPLPGLPSGAFWGTVLEERPGAPTGMMPSQIGQPAQPSQTPIHPAQPQHHEQLAEQIHPSQLEPQEGDRVQRSSTFPALRLRSPITNRQRNQMLPSFPERLPTTAPNVYPEAHASPELPEAAQTRSHPGRRFRRAAGQLLGRLSPFGGPSLSRPSATRSPFPEEQLYQQRQLTTTTALPAIVPTLQMPAQEIFAQTPRDRPFELHQLAPLQGYHPQPPTVQPSGSRSASGSGVSQARTGGNTTSPQAAPEGSRAPRSETASRGRRGRRAGPTPEMEPQFFECEQCDSKFRRKSDKNRHVRVVHEKSRPFVCPVCSKTFGEKSNMLKHRASVHDEIRKFRCPYCELSFSQRGLCDTHVRQVHDKKQAKYFCEHCGLPFSRKVQLHEHYDTVHPEYMATYGRLQTGQPSGAQEPAGTSRAAPRQEAVRGSGGSAAAGRQFPAPEGHMQTTQASMPIQQVQAGPSDPQQWVRYPPSLQPPGSSELQQVQEPRARQRSFQGDSSADNGS